MDGACEFSEDDLKQIRQATRVPTIEHHRQIASTNTRAIMAADDAALPLPALILTDLQTAGRGRGDHVWWSAPGALTCSVILPRIPIERRVPWAPHCVDGRVGRVRVPAAIAARTGDRAEMAE